MSAYVNTYANTRSYEIRNANGKRCPYCHKRMRIIENHQDHPTRDHTDPLPWSNKKDRILIVCAKCNNNKGRHTLRSWAHVLELRNDPRAEIVNALVKQLYPEIK